MTREEAVARIKDHIELHRCHERNAVKIFEALDMAIKALEQSEQRWIPVSERLPEVSGRYLVSEHSPLGEFTCIRYWNQGDRRGYWSGDGYSTVTAWMPLPEPARMDGETNE